MISTSQIREGWILQICGYVPRYVTAGCFSFPHRIRRFGLSIPESKVVGHVNWLIRVNRKTSDIAGATWKSAAAPGYGCCINSKSNRFWVSVREGGPCSLIPRQIGVIQERLMIHAHRPCSEFSTVAFCFKTSCCWICPPEYCGILINDYIFVEVASVNCGIIDCVFGQVCILTIRGFPKKSCSMFIHRSLHGDIGGGVWVVRPDYKIGGSTKSNIVIQREICRWIIQKNAVVW